MQPSNDRRGPAARHPRWRRVLAAASLAALSALAGCGGGGGGGSGPAAPSSDVSEPAAVATTQRFASIGLGNWHSCMLTAAGEAWCWGSNEHGQLGAMAMHRCMSGNIGCSHAPLRAGSGLNFASLHASERHSCGLTAAGAAWCWGFGLGGQLGDGRRADSVSPVEVAGGHVFSALATSAFSGLSCGLAADGSPWCWGPGFGFGTTGPAASPVPLRWDAASSVAWTRLALG
ncbi:MAG TPA: hypothetical protein VGE16_13550, partial [Albitalea sp.]